MADLLAARSQMAVSLAFHIIFAVVGIGMPVLMVIAERRWQKTGDAIYLALAKRWAKGTAVLFAVGAVSGTVLSFELGLLWPRFMGFAGAIVGLPFALAVGGAASVAQPLTGHVIAAALVEPQPLKFAAAEAHFKTGRAVPMHL